MSVPAVRIVTVRLRVFLEFGSWECRKNVYLSRLWSLRVNGFENAMLIANTQFKSVCVHNLVGRIFRPIKW